MCQLEINNHGNSARNVLAPAKALNVITVGNYDDSTENSYGYIIHSTSAFVDPEGGYTKPEISAPGTNIDYDPGMVRDTIPNYKALPVVETGTSFSSPFAACICCKCNESK